MLKVVEVGRINGLNSVVLLGSDDDLRKAAVHLGETVSLSAWQDISTAPKDGCVVLLGNKYGAWVGQYVDRFTSGYKPENPWQFMMLNGSHLGKGASYVPTHWQPLPEPPVTS